MAAEKESATKVDLGLLEEDDEFEEFPADGKESLDSKSTVDHSDYINFTICINFASLGEEGI